MINRIRNWFGNAYARITAGGAAMGAALAINLHHPPHGIEHLACMVVGGVLLLGTWLGFRKKRPTDKQEQENARVS